MFTLERLNISMDFKGAFAIKSKRNIIIEMKINQRFCHFVIIQYTITFSIWLKVKMISHLNIRFDFLFLLLIKFIHPLHCLLF
jgi:hypothetical protein